MSLLDGGRKSALPSMSWRSVVDDTGDTGDTGETGVDPDRSTPVDADPPAPPVGGPGAPDPRTPLPGTASPGPGAPGSPPAGAPVAGSPESELRGDTALEALRLDVPMFELDDDDGEVRRTFSSRRPIPAGVTPVEDARSDSEPAPPVPEIREATPVPPAPEIREATPVPSVPEIREATPVPPAPPSGPTDATRVTSENPLVAPTPSLPIVTTAPSVPSAPSVPAPSPVPVAPGAPTAPVPPSPAPGLAGLPGHPFATPPASPPRHRRRRRGLVLFVVLLVVGGLVAAGVVFGRDYLFPDDWDDAVRPYADAIEEVRGRDFVEPVSVVAVPPMEYQTQMAEQLLGSWEQELPMWRSFGLANGEFEPDALHGLVTERQPALYSEDDGQVYHDGTLVGADLDAQITYAMSVAALDQDLGWTVRQDRRTLDDAALTTASVRRQALDIQAATEFGTPLAATDDQALAFLPPVLGYRVLAPEVFSQLLPSVEPGGANPLADLGVGGPGPIGNETLVLGPDPLAAASSEATILSEPIAMESSFWYLVFAGYLDGATAARMSGLVAANSLAVVEEDGTVCSLVSFTGPDEVATAELRAGLESWASSTPAGLSASVAAIGGGVLLRTCDPGAGFEVGARLGTARELVGRRAVELATVVGVTSAGGSRIDVDAALRRLVESDAAAVVAALPNDTPSEELAEAARVAVVDVVDPPLAPLADG